MHTYTHIILLWVKWDFKDLISNNQVNIIVYDMYKNEVSR